MPDGCRLSMTRLSKRPAWTVILHMFQHCGRSTHSHIPGRTSTVCMFTLYVCIHKLTHIHMHKCGVLAIEVQLGFTPPPVCQGEVMLPLVWQVETSIACAH